MKVKRKKRIGCKKCRHQGYFVHKREKFSCLQPCECVEACKTCNGRGSVSHKNENNYDVISFCPDCGYLRKNIKKYNQAQIPVKFSEVLMVDTYKPNTKSQQSALKHIKEKFINHYPNQRGYLLMGPSGVGKTHLVIGTISELTIEQGVNCLFKDFFLLLTELKQAYSMSLFETDILQPLLEVEVLVIDEMGKGKNTEWELNILDQLISGRYNAFKKTLITTNFLSEEQARKDLPSSEFLEDRIGERMFSRLCEMCDFMYIEGDDYRRSVS